MTSYFDPEIETKPLDELGEIQSLKLKKLLEVTYGSNPFYQKKFQEKGLLPEDIRGLEDMEKLPFSYKREFMRDQEENPPFGTNLSEPLEHYVRYHQTTGTTGKFPLKWLETKESWQWRGRIAAMALWAAGGRAR